MTAAHAIIVLLVAGLLVIITAPFILAGRISRQEEAEELRRHLSEPPL